MGTTADQLRNQIDATRADMTYTLDEFGERVSPRRIAQRRRHALRRRWNGLCTTVMGSASQVGQSTQGAGGAIAGRVGGVTQSAADTVKEVPQVATQSTQGNPLAAGLVAFGVGLLLGSIVPSSDPEQRLAMNVADRAQPAMESLRGAASEVADQAKESAVHAAEEMKSSAADSAEQLKDRANEAGELKSSAVDAAQQVKGRA